MREEVKGGNNPIDKLNPQNIIEKHQNYMAELYGDVSKMALKGGYAAALEEVGGDPRFLATIVMMMERRE